MVLKSLNLKQKTLKLTPLCLGNVSNDFSIDNMKDSRLHGYVYDFTVDYYATAVDDIVDI